MTSEEKDQFESMQEDVKEILRALKGDEFHGLNGLQRDMKEVKNDIRIFKDQIKKARFILYGIGMGFATGGSIFGYVGGKALWQWIQKIFT